MIITALLAYLLEILFPIAIAFWFTRRYHVSWLVVGTGAAAFLLAQALHIPFLQAVQPLVTDAAPETIKLFVTALFLGLAAGLFEETARVAAYAVLRRRARSYQEGIGLGIGHGGAESALFVGLSALISAITMIVLRGNPGLLHQSAVQLQIAYKTFWDSAWYLPFVSLLERLMAFTIQISLSLLVLQAFVRRNALWYVAAVAFHTLVDMTAVLGAGHRWGIAAIEGTVFLFALAAVGIILALRPRFSPPPPEEPPAALS